MNNAPEVVTQSVLYNIIILFDCCVHCYTSFLSEVDILGYPKGLVQSVFVFFNNDIVLLRYVHTQF